MYLRPPKARDSCDAHLLYPCMDASLTVDTHTEDRTNKIAGAGPVNGRLMSC